MKPLLRYSHPAGEYINGLPIGNGRLAAMLSGDEKEVRLALNHEWLWKGENRFRDCDDDAAPPERPHRADPVFSPAQELYRWNLYDHLHP